MATRREANTALNRPQWGRGNASDKEENHVQACTRSRKRSTDPAQTQAELITEQERSHELSTGRSSRG
eukprot:4457722-Pleurochrysis_carterae.AAC.1